jgi:hypothetical protein
MHPALDAYKDVVVVNADRIALELSLKFKEASKMAQHQAFGGTVDAGWFYLYRRDDMHTDTVLECVVSPDSGDMITSLYKNHSIFGDKGELIRARRVLIKAIAEKVGLSAEAIGIEDTARGRALGLTELSTGQLIDLLAERLGHTVVTTDTHGLGLSVH